MQAHEIDYHIFGEEMQYVEIELDPQEIVIAEAGSFMMMENNIQMETIFGDGSAQSGSGGLFGKLLNAGKRVLTGESLFMTAFLNQGNTKSNGLHRWYRRAPVADQGFRSRHDPAPRARWRRQAETEDPV